MKYQGAKTPRQGPRNVRWARELCFSPTMDGQVQGPGPLAEAFSVRAAFSVPVLTYAWNVDGEHG